MYIYLVIIFIININGYNFRHLFVRSNIKRTLINFILIEPKFYLSRAYLRRHRNINTNSEAINSFQKVNDISPRDILSFAWQISKGMTYLTEIKVILNPLIKISIKFFNKNFV